jgi:glycosyltransferase involved in cell wall biosynthesis
MMEGEIQQPLVSVCIQTYQHAAFIRQCLDSVLEQETRFPFEIILGEDDSTDGTRETCIEYANRHPGTIRLFLRSAKDKIFINGSPTGRFNFIENMKAARGKYIALLDGDDYWLGKNKLQTQFDFMESNPRCSLSFHQTLHCIDGKEPFPPSPKFEGRDTAYSMSDILKLTGIFTIHTSNCMFREKHLHPLPSWFYEVPFLDVSLFAHVGQQGDVGFIEKVMSVYRIHRKGMWLSHQEPANFTKMWNLFSVMAAHFSGEMGSVIQERRFRAGNDLVHYYKNHLWESSQWLKEELSKKKFPGDELLYDRLCSSPTLGNYFYSLRALPKKVFRSVLNRTP